MKGEDLIEDETQDTCKKLLKKRRRGRNKFVEDDGPKKPKFKLFKPAKNKAVKTKDDEGSVANRMMARRRKKA